MSLRAFGPKVRAGLAAWLRRDGLAIALFIAAVVVMTYPLAFRPGAGLPSRKGDTLTAIWQKWWLEEALRNGYNPNFTPYLRHPEGLDVTFQPHPWTALGTWRLLAALFGDTAGYNFNFMLGLLASAYAAYLLIHVMTDNRVAAWVGGAFFAFYPAHLLTAMYQPTTGSIQWFPVFMLALVAGLSLMESSLESRRSLTRRRLVAMVFAALTLSINAYISIKPWMQAILLVALYVSLAALANGWWRCAAFWEATGVLAVCSLLLVLPVLVPYLLAGPALDHAVEVTAYHIETEGADVASFVKAAPELPYLMPRSLARMQAIPFKDWRDRNGYSFYLGAISIALAALGVGDAIARHRRRLVWLGVALVLWGLSLGERLYIDGTKMQGVWTPYQLVAQNTFFEAIRTPNRFTLSFSLAWAVLVGFGVVSLGRWLERRRRLAYAVIGCLAALMLFELAEAPLTLYPLEVSPFYYQLRAEDEPGAVIDVPLGYRRGMYLQTIHRRPIVEGKVARPPKGMHDYIEANPLLLGWRQEVPLACDYDVEQAISSLQADDFQYVVAHKSAVVNKKKGETTRWFNSYFSAAEPYYEDDLIFVYTLADLRAHPPPCPSP